MITTLIHSNIDVLNRLTPNGSKNSMNYFDLKNLENWKIKDLRKIARDNKINLKGSRAKGPIAEVIRSFFLDKKEKKKGGLAYIYVRFTLNNIFVNVLDEGKQTLFFFSGGRSSVKGTMRTSNFILQELGEEVGLKILRLKIVRTCIFFKDLNSSRTFFIKGLKKCGLNIFFISEMTSLSHNGCRLPKKRRV